MQPRLTATADPLHSPRFWKAAALFLLCLAFGKGIRVPGPWALTQAQIGYSSGFIRRGLFGATFDHLLGLNHAAHFTLFATFLLLLLLGLLTTLALRSGIAERVGHGEILALAAASYSVAYLAHIVGYLDIPLLLLTILPFFLRSAAARIASACVFTVAGLLIHEQYLFAFVPLVLFSIVLSAFESDSPSTRSRILTGAAVLLLLALLATFCVVHFGAASASQSAQIHSRIAASVDFPLDEDFFHVFAATLGSNLSIMAALWHKPSFYLGHIQSALLFLPTTTLFCIATWFVLQQRERAARARGPNLRLFLAAMAATLAPLTLNLIGYDKNRWANLTCINAFLVLVLVCRFTRGPRVVLPRYFLPAAILVMMLSMASGGGLMDNREIRPFPFVQRPYETVPGVPTPHP